MFDSQIKQLVKSCVIYRTCRWSAKLSSIHKLISLIWMCEAKRRRPRRCQALGAFCADCGCTITVSRVSTASPAVNLDTFSYDVYFALLLLPLSSYCGRVNWQKISIKILAQVPAALVLALAQRATDKQQGNILTTSTSLICGAECRCSTHSPTYTAGQGGRRHCVVSTNRGLYLDLNYITFCSSHCANDSHDVVYL